ncbi:MAG: helix-turn-helix domain-containing protein [Dehalococcoidia bacterium]
MLRRLTAGASPVDLAREYGVSRQRVHQIQRLSSARQPPLPEGFGASVRARRLALGLSQDDLAQCLGVATTTISHLERGTRMPFHWRVFDLALWAIEHGAPRTIHTSSRPRRVIRQSYSPPLTAAQRAQIRALHAGGASPRAIADTIGYSYETVRRVLRQEEAGDGPP